MLTCKSLFGLGYRGERLIEPSSMVVESHGEQLWLVRSWGLRDRPIAGTSCNATGTAGGGKAPLTPQGKLRVGNDPVE